MAIVDWPRQERPREKLLDHGAEALSDAELLAIFLRTGVAGRSAVDLARDLLSRFGGLRRDHFVVHGPVGGPRRGRRWAAWAISEPTSPWRGVTASPRSCPPRSPSAASNWSIP